MDIEEGHSPVRTRVFAQDAEPGGGSVHGLARLDLESTEAGVSLASRQSWRRATSAVVDLGSLAAAGILRDLVWAWPRPDAVAAFGSHAWDVLTREVIGDTPRIDIRKVVRAAWPDLPPGLEADPVTLLAQAGGTPATAATEWQPAVALGRRAEVAAMQLRLVLIGTVVQRTPGRVTWSAAAMPHGRERGVRDRMAAFVRLSTLPLMPPPWPPGPWDDEAAWHQLSGEELRRIASDESASDEAVASAQAELTRRRRA